MLWYLLSKPGDWELQPHDLQQQCGKNQTYKILNELIDHHYIDRVYHRDSKGRISDVEYFVYSKRTVIESAPFPQNQEMDNPEMENRDITVTGNSNLIPATITDSQNLHLSDKSDERESKPKKVVPQNLSLNALAWNISGLTPDQINGKGSYYGMMLNGSPPDKKNRMGLFDLLGMPHPKRGSPEDQALADEINSMYRWWTTAKPGMNKPTGEVTIARAIKDYRASRKPTQHVHAGFQPHETVLHTVQDGVTIPFTIRNGLPYDEHGNVLPPELPPKYKPILPGDPDDDEPQF